MNKLILLTSVAILSLSITSGSWAATCTWEDEAKTKLIITGSGTETFSGCANGLHRLAKEITLGEGITSIGQNAFSDTYSLEKVNMLNVTSIQDWAFHNSSALTTVDMPNVRTIGLGAFENTRALKSVDMPNVTTVGKQAFKDATSLESVSMPNATTIKWGAFNGATSLKSADMPNVTTIETVAFQSAISLESVNMPKVEEIKNDAFARTWNLESITISDTADTIANQAFYSKLYASHDVNYTDVNCIENPSTTNTCEQVKALMKQASAPLKDDAFYIITEPTENCSGYSQGVCSTCKSGYHPADNSCVANPPNCKVFAGNACSECATGYLTKESGCVEPSSCTGEYLISGNECIKMLGCVDYANGACQVCETGYYKKENGCVVATEGCGDGYLEKNSVCISAAQGCGVGYKDMGGFCNHIQWTPAEAAEVLRDDNTNEVTITFRK